MNVLGTYADCGEVRLPTRCFLAPTNTGFAEGGYPTAKLVAFHCERSGKKIGISYVGNVAIAPSLASNANTLYFTTADKRWHDLTAAIEAAGSIPGVQLGCRRSKKAAPKRWRGSDVVTDLHDMRAEVLSLPSSELVSVIKSFAQSARMAADSGFKVVQIHAAHGYLLAQFLSPAINLRRDEYGKDRSLLLSRVTEAIKSVVDNVALDVRLSLVEGLANVGVETDAKHEQVARLVAEGIDMISLSAGTYDFSRGLIYPAKRDGENVLVPYAERYCLDYPTVLWNVAGNIRDLNALALSVPDNLTVSLCRPLLADPQFVEKQLTSGMGSVRECDWSGKCHYYTRGSEHICCPNSIDLRLDTVKAR